MKGRNARLRSVWVTCGLLTCALLPQEIFAFSVPQCLALSKSTQQCRVALQKADTVLANPNVTAEIRKSTIAEARNALQAHVAESDKCFKEYGESYAKARQEVEAFKSHGDAEVVAGNLNNKKADDNGKEAAKLDQSVLKGRRAGESLEGADHAKAVQFRKLEADNFGKAKDNFDRGVKNYQNCLNVAKNVGEVLAPAYMDKLKVVVQCRPPQVKSQDVRNILEFYGLFGTAAKQGTETEIRELHYVSFKISLATDMVSYSAKESSSGNGVRLGSACFQKLQSSVRAGDKADTNQEDSQTLASNTQGARAFSLRMNGDSQKRKTFENSSSARSAASNEAKAAKAAENATAQAGLPPRIDKATQDAINQINAVFAKPPAIEAVPFKRNLTESAVRADIYKEPLLGKLPKN